MDQFGIGAVVRGAANVYFLSARGTGRTTSLVESVKDGDRIVFSNSRDAKRVQRLCKERGVAVECIVVEPRDPRKLFEVGTSQGRTIFDHTWLEQFYTDALLRAQNEIDHLERETSGYGAAHRETRLKAEELVKWHMRPMEPL